MYENICRVVKGGEVLQDTRKNVSNSDSGWARDHIPTLKMPSLPKWMKSRFSPGQSVRCEKIATQLSVLLPSPIHNENTPDFDNT